MPDREHHPQGLIKRIFGNLGWLLGGKAAAGVISLVYMIIAARALGPHDYGVLVLIHAYILSVDGLVNFPAWQTVVRYGYRPLREGRFADVVALMRFTGSVELVIGLFAAAAAALLSGFIGHKLSWPPEAYAFAIPYSLAALANTRSTPAGYLQLVRRFDLLGWHNSVSPAVRLIGAALEKGRKIDATLTQYLKSIISVLLTLVLVLAILDIFGIKTTSFAALLAGAGLAIGAAWSGMLGNFAAGLFLQVLRPYKVGDFINAGGTLGTVKELGLFATTVLTPDNVLTVVGNNKVFADNVQNFSAEPYRRVDCVAKVANSVDVQDAIARLRPAIAAIANVKDTPAPDIEILQFTPEGPLLCVRPYTHTDHYWQVYFDTHKAIVATFGAAGYPVPETPVVHRTV